MGPTMMKDSPVLEDQKFNAGDVAALPYATNIDRRQCKRIIPLKVLALGVSGSGTSSPRQALVDLGYKDCYHYASLLQENSRDQDMWIEAYEAKYEGKGRPLHRKDWDQLLGHCQALTDTPCAVFYKEDLDAYPDAKVILTVRDSPEQWHKSILATLVPWVEENARVDANLLIRLWRRFGPLPSRTFRFVECQFKCSPMFVKLVDGYRNGTTTAQQWYVEHVEEIKSLVPKENLLAMNVKEGWGPLCGFLGHDVPLYLFPRKNDTATFQHNTAVFGDVINEVARWNFVKTVAAVAAVAALGVSVAFGVRRYGSLKGL